MHGGPGECPAGCRRDQEGGLNGVGVHRLAEFQDDSRDDGQIGGGVRGGLADDDGVEREHLRLGDVNFCGRTWHGDDRCRVGAEGSRHHDGVIGVQQIHEHGAGGVRGWAIGQDLGGAGGIEADEDFLVAQHARVGEQPGAAVIGGQIVLCSRSQGRIEAAEIVHYERTRLKEQVRFVEVVAHGGGVWFPLAREHVLAVVIVVAVAGERLFGSVVEAGDAARGVEELQRDREAVRGCATVARGSAAGRDCRGT